MKKVFMVHGFNGKPNGGWRPWLMGELGKKDIYACALPLPNPNDPIKEEWVKTISEAVFSPDENIFLVGHSLGVPAILRYLETIDESKKIGGVVLVSGPVFETKKDGYERVDNFLKDSFNFEHIKKVCKKFAIVHGSDDGVVPFSNAEFLADKLSCDLLSVEGGKHLNGSSGWYKLPQVLKSLNKMF